MSDIVQAIEIIIQHKNFTDPIINIGNGVGVKIKDAVEIFLEMMGRTDVKLSFKGVAREGDPDIYIADISKLKEVGYSQKISIEMA